MTGKRIRHSLEGPPDSSQQVEAEGQGLERRGTFRLPVAREGFPFILISLAATMIVFWLTGLWWARSFFVLLTLFVVAFFRDPERAVPGDPNSIVSPADGKVIKVERIFDSRFLNAEANKISIFMSLFNVHVNRAPASGRVLKVVYNQGRFFSANLDKASLCNEQNAVIAEGPGGKQFVFNQIAGLVARRIVCYLKEGSVLTRGERFGLIRFGSRLDVFLPVVCPVSVKVGEKVKAGATVLGYWK